MIVTEIFWLNTLIHGCYKEWNNIRIFIVQNNTDSLKLPNYVTGGGGIEIYTSCSGSMEEGSHQNIITSSGGSLVLC